MVEELTAMTGATGACAQLLGHHRFLEWAGGLFNPTAIDLIAVNAALQHGG